jgi:hypothetical protein
MAIEAQLTDTQRTASQLAKAGVGHDAKVTGARHAGAAGLVAACSDMPLSLRLIVPAARVA